MGNRNLRKAIQSLQDQIKVHHDKIALEQQSPKPNWGVIAHWESEIRAFQMRLNRLETRLEQRRRRGR